MTKTIQALLPRDANGHQFVMYADACSGVVGAPHEATFTAVNQIIQALTPAPQFICFPGDEIIGLTADEAALRQQWATWFNHEMAWLDRDSIPLYHTTGNHTTYDEMSERVFRDVMAHLPQNGPADQKGLSYFVRRGDLLMVFINTLWSGEGGEGYVETEWLAQTLAQNADATHKLVFGHHPVFSVNGFSGQFQRDVGAEYGRSLWQLFVKHNVLAYVCSHILAFDVQVHEGVLQICTAGAGTRYRMPEDVEYLHAMQATLDSEGFRYQVLDTSGTIREWLNWPLTLSPSQSWPPFTTHLTNKPTSHPPNQPAIPQTNYPSTHLTTFHISGTSVNDGKGNPQTLIYAGKSHTALPLLWLGLRGREQRLALLLRPAEGRSPHLWLGPKLGVEKRPFSIQVALHFGMGPGGILWRWDDDAPWSSMVAASPWGLERLPEQLVWGNGRLYQNSDPFRGDNLTIRALSQHHLMNFHQ